MTRDDHPAMSDYERKAWQALTAQPARKQEDSRYHDLVNRGRARVRDATSRVATTVRRVPGTGQAFDAVDVVIRKAVEGLHTVFVERGLHSVTPLTVYQTFAAEGVAVTSYEDIRALDLKVCDRTVPRRKERYIGLAAVEGAATSLAVTGATVSSTVTGGITVGVALAVVTVDVTAVLVGMGRIVSLVGAHYGYDVREPEEQVFASGVLAYSTAGNAAEKATALAALSRLTQDMMRRATWRQLQQHQIVSIIKKVVSSLGFKLTHRKLAQAVPIAGTVLNSGLNAHITYRTFDRAQRAYRLRFLTEKYNLDPEAWTPDIVDAEVTDIPRVDELFEEQLQPGVGEETTTDPDHQAHAGSPEPATNILLYQNLSDCPSGNEHRLTVWGTYTSADGLTIEGSDSTDWPCTDLTYAYHVAPEHITQLRSALGAADNDDLLELVKHRMPPLGVDDWLDNHGVTYTGSETQHPN